MTDSPVRTRFAPSPTGYLHIGGVRTALFNWLFAKQHGGQFILRIDDTDQERNVAEALQPILDGFRWLGVLWDEGPEVGGPCGPYYQSQRSDHYDAAVDTLLGKGLAYRDYARADEVQQEREQAEKEKRDFVYSRRWMAETDEQAQAFEAEGRQSVVRLKMPREGVCSFQDIIRGEMTFEWCKEQDHVIQRADGTCLYHLASVVDDEAFRISHVIRASEHLANTPRQIFIAQGLGYSIPEYAHLPVVAEPGSKNKLSKRKVKQYLKNPEFLKLYNHGQNIAQQIGLTTSPDSFNPVLVDFYQQVGYLPEALLNYLLLLGWSLDDKTEEFSQQEMIQQFTLQRVVKSPASFDPQKLTAFQDRYMQRVPLEQKVASVAPYLQNAGLIDAAQQHQPDGALFQIVAAAGDRIKTAGDILDYADFFLPTDQIVFEDKAFQKRLVKPPEAAELLRQFQGELNQVDPFDADTLHDALHQFVERQQIKIGQIIHALRVALTGKAVGFGMFETMAILGRDRCVQRIDRALEHLAANTN